MQEKPNPGSEEAREQGCKCPVIDNGHGEGAWGGVEYDGRKVFYFPKRVLFTNKSTTKR